MKKIKNKAKKMYKEARKQPEEATFAFLILLSLVFAGMCFGNIRDDVRKAGISSAAAPEKKQSQHLERKIKSMVTDSPIEEMSPYIARQNEKVAAYLVAIAKKESDWGKYSPQKRGKNCYNYWGFKGSYNRNAAGYSCFDSPAQAVNVVGKRINNLIAQKVDTPSEMVLWKCGSSCTTRSSADAAKWARDVGMYYKKMHKSSS